MKYHYRIIDDEAVYRGFLKINRYRLSHELFAGGESVELVRIAVASGLFPVYEVFDGATYRVNIRPDGADPAEYFERQGRFRDDEIDLEATREACAERVRRLALLENHFPYPGH